MQRRTFPGGSRRILDPGAECKGLVVRIDHRLLIGDANPQVIKRVVVQRLAAGSQQHEVQLQIGADECGIPVRPLLRPGVQQPGIESHARGEIGDADAAMEFAGIGSLWYFEQPGQDLDAGLDLLAGAAEAVENLFRRQAGVVRDRIGNRPVKSLHPPGQHRAHFVRTKRDHQVHGGRVDVVHRRRLVAADVDADLRHGGHGVGVDPGRARAGAHHLGAPTEDPAGQTLGHLAARRVGNAQEQDSVDHGMLRVRVTTDASTSVRVEDACPRDSKPREAARPRVARTSSASG